MGFPERLKALRLEANLTQKEIAEKFDVDERTIKRNRNLLVNTIANNLFESEFLQKIKNIFL